MLHFLKTTRTVLLTVATAFALAACGGGGGGGSSGGSNEGSSGGSSGGDSGSTSCSAGSTLVNGVCQAIVPAVPTLTLVSKSQTEVNLSWAAVSGASTYALTRTSGVNSTAQNKTGTTATDSGLSANTSYSYTLKACSVQAVCSAASVALAVTTHPLPVDTGITASQCYAAGSNALVSCTATGTGTATDLSPTQDGMVGRDVSSNSTNDGKLGFSYSQVTNAGTTYAITECVKDNITGLTWEGKPASSTRGSPALNSNGTYTNYQMGFTDGNGNTVTQTQVNANTNAQGYLNAVNTAGLCGYSDWRLPTRSELQTLVDYGVAYPGPTIDGTWFPNTPPNWYWTSSPYVNYSDYAWFVDFGNGGITSLSRVSNSYVRLVR